MELDKINLDGLTEEQVKFKVFKTVFERSSNDVSLDWLSEDNDDYKWLRDRNLLSVAIEGNFLKAISIDFFQFREDDYDIMESYYLDLLNKMKKLSLELGLENSLELSNLYAYLLWNGYLSKTKQNVYKIEGRKVIFGMFFADIMDGIGVCLNHADMLKDFLNNCGFDAAVMANLVDKNIDKDYKMRIERKIKKSTLRTKTLNFVLTPVIKRFGNHAFTLVKDNGKMYIYDSTNLIILKVKEPRLAEVINGSGSCRLNPYFSCLLTGGTEKEMDVISKLFEMDDFSSPYSRKDFICMGEENIELFKNNISLLDDFYDDVSSDIIVISETSDKIKARKKKRK